MRPRFEVAQLIDRYGKEFIKSHPQPIGKLRTLLAIRDCRTPALGGQQYLCNCCNKTLFSWHSCRNRHCPKCQATNREKWIWAREQELLPVPYFHVVFTLPHELNALAIKHPKEVYNALFKAAWNTLNTFGLDHTHLGAQTGMTAVLHTWGQNLCLHPHLHCIVPGGGLLANGKWKNSRSEGKYLFPSQALARVFRAKYVACLRKASIDIPQDVAKVLFDKPWVVYAKRPFAGPKQVVEYLGRYTHKIAISNHRIQNIASDGKVTFKWKDYRHANQIKLMELDPKEFLRRFSLHILPAGFVRIRHYGILSCRNKTSLLNRAKEHFNKPKWQKPRPEIWKEEVLKRLNINPSQCPFCKKGELIPVRSIEPNRGPPTPQQPLKPNLNFYAS